MSVLAQLVLALANPKSLRNALNSASLPALRIVRPNGSSLVCSCSICLPLAVEANALQLQAQDRAFSELRSIATRMQRRFFGLRPKKSMADEGHAHIKQFYPPKHCASGIFTKNEHRLKRLVPLELSFLGSNRKKSTSFKASSLKTHINS